MAQEVEPNDSQVQANAMFAEESVAIPGLIRNSMTGEISTGESDFFSVDILAGDRVSVSVSRSNSDLNPQVSIRNVSGQTIRTDHDSGPGQDSLAATFSAESSGTYIVEVASDYPGSTGRYQVHALVARGLGFESDPGQRNDGVYRTDPITLSADGQYQSTGRIAGTISSLDETSSDVDFFRIGWLDAGVNVSVDLHVPEWSDLDAIVQFVDAGGTLVAESVRTTSGFEGIVETAGAYFARVTGLSNTGPSAQYSLDVNVNDTIDPMVTSISRLTGDPNLSNEVFATFSVQFSEPLRHADLITSIYDLRESGDDGAFGTADDTLYSMRIDHVESEHGIDFEVTDGPLGNGDYRLTLPNTVADLVGNSLGNGSGFVRTFTVDAVPEGGVFEGRDNSVFTKATPLAMEIDTNGTGWLRSEIGYGSMDPTRDQDWWSFTSRAGDNVDVWARNRVGNELLFLKLHRRRDDGTSLTKVADGHGPGVAYISGVKLPSDGTYYVQVANFTLGRDGYELSVNLHRTNAVETDAWFENDDSHPDSLEFARQGNSRVANIAGTVGSIGDEDRYALGFLQAGTTVTIDAASLPHWSTLEPEVRVYRKNPGQGPNVLLVTDTEPADNLFTGLLDADATYFAEIRARTVVHGGQRITLVDDLMTWSDAEAFAVEQGGHLVSVDSAQKQAFIVDTFGADYWIGLNDTALEGMFVWSDGTVMLYDDWYAGSAENASNTSDRDHAYQTDSSNGSWYVDDGTRKRRSLIQQPTTSGEPPTFGPGLHTQYLLKATISELVPPVVTSVSRLPGEAESTTVVLGSFEVNFSEPLDRTTLTDTAFDLRAAGQDDEFDTSDDIVYSLAASSPFQTSARFALNFEVTNGPLANGEYRFTIASSITDTFGNGLAGEAVGSIGRDFVRNFTVDAIPDDVVFEGRDNGDYTKATPLTLEIDPHGTGWLRSEIGYGSVDPSNDQDWWSFDGEAGDRVDIWTRDQFEGDQSNITLFRLQNDGTEIKYLTRDVQRADEKTAYISGFELPVDGTYYVRVDSHDDGDYDLRVNLNRATNIELDGNFANDQGAAPIPFSINQDGSRSGTIAGTVSSIDDEDRYSLGFMKANTTITVDAASLPQWSRLEPDVRVFRVDPTNPTKLLLVGDTDPADDVFTGTLDVDGTYVTEVSTRTAVRDGSRYTMVDDLATWADAEAFAVSQNGHLASIASEQEQAFIVDTFGTSWLWIGLNDAAQEGTFVWSDGTPLSYEHWHSSSPQYPRNTDANDHAFLYPQGLGLWYIGTGTTKSASIIEQPTVTGDPAESGPGVDAQYLLNVAVSNLVADDVVVEGSDNDDYTTATPLALEVDVNGTGWLRSEIGRGSIYPFSDHDWWSFEGRTGESVDVWAQELNDGNGPYITLYRPSDDGANVTSMVGNHHSGPDDTAYISSWKLPSDGNYYVRVDGRNGQGIGGYDLRVNLNRTSDIEFDADFANDDTGDSLLFTVQGNTRTATVAGTVSSINDEDRFGLGLLNAGTTVTLDAGSIPMWSTLEPEVRVYRVDPGDSSNLVFVTDTVSAKSVFSGTLDVEGTYFAEVRTRTAVYDGNRLTLTDDDTTWTDADSFAASQGGQLVSIDSEQKQAFIADHFGSGFWIGLNDAAEEGTFVWSDGTPIGQDIFYDVREKIKLNVPSRDYVYFSGKWDDWIVDSHTRQLRSLIQQPAVAGDPLTSGFGLNAQYLLNVTLADLIPPSVTSIRHLPDDAGYSLVGLSSFDVHVNEPVEPTSLRNVFSLTLNGQEIDLGSVAINEIEPTRYKISGLGSLTAIDGAYELTIDMSKLVDRAGLTGDGKTTRSWTQDTIVPTTQLAANIFTLTPLRYLVDIESEDTGTAPTGIAGVKIFTAAANQPLKLTNEIGPSVSPIQYVAPVDEDHVFFASASDVAGNVQPLLIDSAGAFTVNVDSELILDLPGTLIIAEGTDSKFAGNWGATDPIMVNGVMHHQLIAGDQVISVQTTTPWKNPLLPQDVNRSGDVTILDALRILNRVNRFGFGLPTPAASQEHAYLDVTGDGRVSVLDALRVINELSRQRGVAGEGEAAELTATDQPSRNVPAAAMQNSHHLSPVNMDDDELAQVDFGLTPKATTGARTEGTHETDSVDEIFTAIGIDSDQQDDASEFDRNDPLSLLGSTDRKLN